MTFLSRAWTTLANCKSPADFYRLQIDIQQFATPNEVMLLADASAARPIEFDKWLRGLVEAMTIAHSENHAFRMRLLASGVQLYTTGNRKNRLVIGFCGKAGLLFMPIPLILQYFAHADCDFLVLRDEARLGFVAGIAGYSPSFAGLIEKLNASLNLRQYDEVRTFGTSGGGAAALGAGVALHASHAACFSSHMPLTSARYATRPGAPALEALLRNAAPLTRYACVFGADNPSDAERAHEIGTALRLRLIPIPGVSNHNVVWELHKQNRLLGLFREVGLI